ncbi:MAG TPA: hypothetical protein VMM18_12765 [Gemmatimonadaceae bacterium]|nr:hypothetical protein [Gemmatimonadaceae bacterium]
MHAQPAWRWRAAPILAIPVVLLACDTGTVSPESTAPAAMGRAAGPAAEFSAWTPAIRVEDIPGTHPMFNTSSLDGCPLVSRDGKSFFMASDRPGGLGGIDIAKRNSVDDPWGEPVNVGAPINSEYNDFCPTIDRDGHRFFFVSERPTWSGGAACGGADIYITRFRADGTADDHRTSAATGMAVRTAPRVRRARRRCRRVEVVRCSTSPVLARVGFRPRLLGRSVEIRTST